MFEAVNAKIKSLLEELKQMKAECEDLQECKTEEDCQAVCDQKNAEEAEGK